VREGGVGDSGGDGGADGGVLMWLEGGGGCVSGGGWEGGWYVSRGLSEG